MQVQYYPIENWRGDKGLLWGLMLLLDVPHVQLMIEGDKGLLWGLMLLFAVPHVQSAVEIWTHSP
ncbi:hypothetical protein KSF_079940 [Reticulibacter mediterranei]|uniref:Uncharacterized protein n=2 Tax=Reticulibacter mediterranei TaxID=2778369 RepID=A0A8J3INR5_9CHLR|nr:hypothetical protein KSF_079940 [Reticulibacter mediterranei]